MGRIADLLQRYDAAREHMGLWVPEEARATLSDWASGDAAVEVFGSDVDELDALCMMQEWERAMPFVLYSQIRQSLGEQGRSWNEVSIALGVSRQAAVKRFDW